MPIFLKLFLIFTLSQLWIFPFIEAKASVFIINNIDVDGEGFSDTTPFTGIGGNNAATLGEARLVAFRYAADRIADVLSGDHVITVDVSMLSLGGGSIQATLGGAGAVAYVYDFVGAPEKNMLYPIALANKLFGGDIDPSKADISARFNSDIDEDNILTGSRWYYGLDGKSGSQDIDFVTVVMHELVHGLGFSSTINLTTGSKIDGRDDVFSRHLYHSGITPPFYEDMTDLQRMLANIATNQLHWNGPHTNRQAQQVLKAGLSDDRVEMFAPAEAVERSSLSHFSSAVEPNEMMEPFYTVANHELGLATGVLSDIGWGDQADLTITVTEQATDALSFTNQYTVTVMNNGPDTAHDVSVVSRLLEGQVMYQSALSPSTISCEQNSQSILCKLGNINNGSQVSYTLTTVRNTLSAQSFKNSIVADIVDVTSANNESVLMIEGISAQPDDQATLGEGGGGMMNVFFLMMLLSVALILLKQRQSG